VRDACSQKVSKNPKIVCAQVTLTKTGLSAVRTFSPLGVKGHATIFLSCQNQLQTWEYKARSIPSLGAKIMNYFIFLALNSFSFTFEELLDAAMWLKPSKD
jgi:hypothetical protein